MLFLQFVQYLSSFVVTPKNEIQGAALELEIKQFSPEIHKFSTKHEDNPFDLNYYKVPSTFLFIFHAGSGRLDWALIIFGTQLIKKIRPVRPVFPDYLSDSYDYGLILLNYIDDHNLLNSGHNSVIDVPDSIKLSKRKIMFFKQIYYGSEWKC